jgi:hypothetical protein
MSFNTLLCSDLHLTNRPLDDYRFGLFEWIRDNKAQWGISTVTILGDLTDSKDRHDSIFVNKVVDAIQSIELPTYILMGNHDYIDPSVPFFKFLNQLDNITYYYEPSVVTPDDYGVDALFLPHTRGGYPPLKDWNAPYIFCHQTFKGAAASNGMEMDGDSVSIFDGCDGIVYAGDIHVPQKIGPVTYVGAPYRITYGDNYNPRCLLLDFTSGEDKAVRYPCLSKHTLTVRNPEQILEHKNVKSGDQVKVRLKLLKAEYNQWSVLRSRVTEICVAQGLILSGVELLSSEDKSPVVRDISSRATPVDVFNTYCDAENLSDEYQQIGRRLMDDIRYD